MQMVSLFSGIGGFEIAGEWMGWDIVSSCEINPFGRKILEYYWPNAYHHDNVKTIDYEKIRIRINPARPTIIVAGFPCQPFSQAGKRKGTEDERYGWPDCIKAVRELRPDWCVFENVFGLINWNGGMVFDEVQADLEAAGYEVWPYVLPACAVNAPHRRDRVWFVAYANGKRLEKTGKGFSEKHKLFTNPPNDFFRGFSSQLDPSKRSSGVVYGKYGLSEELDTITVSEHTKESIKAAGNAIVPQIAFQIFKAIDQYSSL